MSEEVRIWRIEEGKGLREIKSSHLDFERRLEDWVERDISILDPSLWVIGRQVQTDFGGIIDLLCMNEDGDVIVVELKRDKTPREITAQVLDYGSWVKDLSSERIRELAESFVKKNFEEAFKLRFRTELPETLNETHRLLIVASHIDPSSERIIRYLSETYGVNINAATFQYFKAENGEELLARVFLLEPDQVEIKSRASGLSKRLPNLTYGELESKADTNGVGDLYRYAVSCLERHLQKHTTRSTIGFAGNFDGSKRNVLSLVPEQSSAQNGLCFQVYKVRLMKLFNLSEESVLAILTKGREPWIYYPGAGPEYEGFRGFFVCKGEIDTLVNGLMRSSSGPGK